MGKVGMVLKHRCLPEEAKLGGRGGVGGREGWRVSQSWWKRTGKHCLSGQCGWVGRGGRALKPKYKRQWARGAGNAGPEAIGGIGVAGETWDPEPGGKGRVNKAKGSLHRHP